MKKLPGTKYLGLIIAVAVSLLFSLLLYFDTLESWNNLLSDSIYQKKRGLGSEIVIVGIDDVSLEALGKWPWPRSYHGLLLEAIDSGAPKAIGVDVLFIEDSEEDEYFADSLRTLSQKPVLACYGVLGDKEGPDMLYPVIMYKPAAMLREFADLAHINAKIDKDGFLRHTILHIYDVGAEGAADANDPPGDELPMIPSFALKIAKKAYGRSFDPPTDDCMRMPIRYAGKGGTFEQVPYYMVLTGEIDPEYFRDKIVLIGPTAVGLVDDYYFTPINRSFQMYGVEVHANIIDQLSRGLSWQPLSKALQIAVLIALTLIAVLLLSRMRLLSGLLTVLALMGGLVGCGIYLAHQERGYLLDLIYPLGSISISFVLFYILRYVEEFVERKRVTNVFGRYMEPRLVERLLKEGAELGGERRELSVLFVDIRGFTPMSESLEPEQVVGILNEYLELVAQSIFKTEGTLDKYIGDAAMGLFGAPLELEDHAFRAVEAALHMKQGSEELGNKLLEKYGRTVSFGIGINTGEAIVGNIGASHRMDYTAIGDTVNTAARLESNAAPGQILISRATYDLVKDKVEVNPLGELKVKGKANVVEIFEVMGIKQ